MDKFYPVVFSVKSIIISEINRLPLECYGTGLHELLIMVIAAYLNHNSIVCIEEPDIHLHPSLQKEFIKFLINNTDNIYFLSTHSPTMLNVSSNQKADMQVFHIIQTEKGSKGKPIFNSLDARSALSDLGIKASDLLQANCIIWIEGPSDRIYIKHWLSLIKPELEEGKHFSFMFYGGCGQIKYLTINDGSDKQEQSDLINLFSINPNAIFVGDSDKVKPNSKISSNLVKICNQVEEKGGIGWITKGRTIENYLPQETVIRGLKTLCKIEKEVLLDSISIYDDFSNWFDCQTQKYRENPKKYSKDKPTFAREFMKDFKINNFDKSLIKEIHLISQKIIGWNN